MSVLSKMTSTDKYLSAIYKDVKKEIKDASNLSKDMAQARRLQALLRQVKFMQKQYATSGSMSIGGDFPFAAFWDRAEQIAMMQSLYEINPKIFTEGTFIDTFKGSEKQSFLLGESLEIGVARLIYGIGAKVSNQSYTSAKTQIKSKVGGLHTQVPDLVGGGTEIMQQIFNSYYEEIGKALKTYRGDTKHEAMTTMRSVQGKIDNVGFTSEFALSVDVTGMDKDIVNALKDATFTDKNYLSTTELKFGQTNPFRVFATVAPEGQETVARFSRMINCFENHGDVHLSAPATFYRLRAIYELTGARMKYTEKSLESNSMIRTLLEGQVAKYLIWNTPYGDIHVIPTRKIVEKVIDSATMALPKNWQDALYGPITLPQTSLDSLL